MAREHIVYGVSGPVYVSETDTRQHILCAVYLNETVVISVEETLVQRGGSSKRRKRPRPRYWWEEEEEQETILTPEVIAALPPIIKPEVNVPRVRFHAEPEKQQVDLAPMMRAMRKRAKMKLAAMIALDMLDE